MEQQELYSCQIFGEIAKSINEVVSLVKGKYLPYLDTCMFWDKELEELRFKVFLKPEQRLKYLNKGNEDPNSIVYPMQFHGEYSIESAS